MLIIYDIKTGKVESISGIRDKYEPNFDIRISDIPEGMAAFYPETKQDIRTLWEANDSLLDIFLEFSNTKLINIRTVDVGRTIPTHEPEPTTDEYLLELEYRLSRLELGL